MNTHVCYLCGEEAYPLPFRCESCLKLELTWYILPKNIPSSPVNMSPNRRHLHFMCEYFSGMSKWYLENHGDVKEKSYEPSIIRIHKFLRMRHDPHNGRLRQVHPHHSSERSDDIEEILDMFVNDHGSSENTDTVRENLKEFASLEEYCTPGYEDGDILDFYGIWKGQHRDR